MNVAAAFEWPVRIYWEDTDAGGVVYYANYLKFLERARTEWLRSLGHSQQALATDPGILFMVVNLNLDYFRPARLDDALRVTCVPERDGRVTMRFRQQILRDAPGREPLVDATIRVACLDARTLRPRRIPDFVERTAAAAAAEDRVPAGPLQEDRNTRDRREKVAAGRDAG